MMFKLFLQLLTKEDGPTAVEYAVLLALILAVTVAAIATLGAQTSATWSNNQNQMNNSGLGGS